MILEADALAGMLGLVLCEGVGVDAINREATVVGATDDTAVVATMFNKHGENVFTHDDSPLSLSLLRSPYDKHRSHTHSPRTS